ncbi:MAG: DUF951 domain-containing protein [Anaerofustis stercorihominis]|nr:DUF951 domain-containing protein [Anaerofustis stercorihominis]
MEKQYGLNDIVQMKKPHACGTNRWQVIRVGADIKIKCVECTRIVMMSREKFDKGLKKILESQN